MPLIELHPSRFPAHLSELFNAADPLSVRAFGVLQGSRKGRALVDHAEQPRCALLQEAAECCAYLGGHPNATWISTAIRQLRQQQAVLIGLWPDDPRWASVPTNAAMLGNSIDFERRDPQQHLEALLHVPDECQLQRMDIHLAQHSSGFLGWCEAFGGVEAYLAAGVAYGLWRSGTLVSEASVDPPANGVMEIGTGTHPDWRGWGYATLVCAQAVLDCERRGDRVHWNCNALNEASAAIAHKLGYTQSRSFPWRYWEQASNL